MKYVLVVDDSEATLCVLANELEKYDFIKPTFAKSYKEAMNLIEANEVHFHAALLDLHLPDASEGEIVALANAHNIPAVILTATLTADIKDSILKKAIVDCVSKKDPDSIKFAVNSILRTLKNYSTTVLVVDSSKLYRYSLSSSLKEIHLNVIEAKNGQKALDILDQENHGISLVITGFEMPNMDGQELTFKIREKYKKDQLAIIAMSSSDKQDVITKFLKFGANDFIHKPFAHNEIITRINSNLDLLDLFSQNNQIMNNLKNTMISRDELSHEVKLRKVAEERYELAINGAQDGLWDWNITENTVYFSPTWKSILGYTDAEIPNSFEQWEKRLHPKDSERVHKDIKDNQEGKTSVYENINRLKHKNGHWVWILDRGKTTFDENGEAIRMTGFHTDITEMKSLENRLSKEIQKTNELGVIIKNSINEVYIFDKNNLKFLFVNERALIHTGFSLDEMLTKTAIDINSLLTKDKFNEIINPLKNREKEYVKFSVLHERKDKTTYPVDITLQYGTYEGKECYVAIVVDVTEREKMLNDIQNQEKIMVAQSRHAAMGEMISMIAHQWRQPISTIAMSVNNIVLDMEIGTLNNKDLKNECDEIINQTKYLSETINDFKNFFKPNKNIEKVDVEDIYNEVYKIMGKSLETNNIILASNFNTNKKIETYSREILQVFINIIKNSKEALEEYRKEDRKIEVEVDRFGDGVVISVSDNAGGIDKSIIDKIFDPYFSTKDEQTGTGLGLYMSKTIIEKHLKGTIKVKNINEGVEFEIVLPLTL